MPRYHFNIHEPDSRHIDETGEHLGDRDAAQREAIRTLCQIAADRCDLTSSQEFIVDVREDDVPCVSIRLHLEIAPPRQ